MSNQKDIFLDEQSRTALKSLQRLTGAGEATCIRLALVLSAETIIYVTALQNAKGNEQPGKTLIDPVSRVISEILPGWLKPEKTKKGRRH